MEEGMALRPVTPRAIIVLLLNTALIMEAHTLSCLVPHPLSSLLVAQLCLVRSQLEIHNMTIIIVIIAIIIIIIIIIYST